MDVEYNTSAAGCRAFVNWLRAQASSSAAWKHINEDDKRDLEKALSILADDPADALAEKTFTHEDLWRVLGAAFIVGRCGNFAGSDAAYYDHVHRPMRNRKAKASKRENDPAQQAIEAVIVAETENWDGSQPWPLAAKIAGKLSELGHEKGCSPDAIVRRLNKMRPHS